MARHRFSNPPFDQINVTNLIDTLFFLLIIFMLTAPILEYKMDVNPPVYTAETIKADDYSKTINVRKDGTIVMDRVNYTTTTLASRLRELRSSSKKYHFFLRADADLKYGQVIAVLRNVRSAGFSEISLVTAAEDK